MLGGKRGFALLISLVLSFPASATLLPDLERDKYLNQRTGASSTMLGPGIMAYDASLGRLSFSHDSGFYDFVRPGPAPGEFYTCAGFIGASAGVGQNGVVTDPGSFIWYGDCPDFSGIIATGNLREVGSLYSRIDPETGRYVYTGLQLLFDFDYLRPDFSAMGDWGLLTFSTPFFFDQPIFLEDFFCDGETCPPFSNHYIRGISAAEPGTLALLSLGLAGLGFARRRSLG